MKGNLILVLVVSLFACQEDREYWEIDHFNLVENALDEGEKFKVIYYLMLAQNDNKENAFNHYIVISEETGDTVNILSNGASPIDGPDEIYSFSSKHENLIVAMLNNEIKDGRYESVEDVIGKPDVIITKGRKVLRDRKFDDLANNNFPTIIGSLGKVTPNK
jgi:hypothetical protein